MQLIPLDPHEKKTNDEVSGVTLTGIKGSGAEREQLLEALRLNRQLLHAPQPDVEVDENAVRATIDHLLDQLNAVPPS